MKFGFTQNVNNFLLDNVDEDITITNNASTRIMNHQKFKENRNAVFEKCDEVTLNHCNERTFESILTKKYKSAKLKQFDKCIKRPHSEP